MGSGGASFHPGSIGGGGRFGSIMGGNKGSGAGHHAVSKPNEKPLKVSAVKSRLVEVHGTRDKLRVISSRIIKSSN